MFLRSVWNLFRIPETSPSLALAHLTALKQQVPLLYLILTVNAATLAYTHYDIAPHPLVILPVLALSAICVVRAVTWTRLNLNDIPKDRYVPLLRRTNRLTAYLSPAFLVWSLSLAYYGNEVTNLHVFFFLALTPIGCIFCLMHLRSAALIIAATVTAPAVAFVLNRHGAVLTSIAINLMIVGSVMLYILFIHYRSFVRLAKQNEELKDLNDRTLLLASTDVLTGLPNRRSFFPTLDDAVGRRGPADGSIVFGVLDLDDFKNINDSLGHVAGDRILVETADRLRNAIPAGSTLARLGGDEFALIMYESSDQSWNLEQIATAALVSIRQPIAGFGSNVRISASIGFARCTQAADGGSAELIERADFALHEAKTRHRGGWILFADQHEAVMRQQSAIENALRQADLNDELSLAFQPMIDVKRRETVAFEALARWQSPTLGRVPPDQFIAAAERIGLINEMTLVLFRKALAALVTWPQSASLSFNLSMADITSHDAVTRLCDLITSSDVDPSRLQFEVTETAMLLDFESANANLIRLKQLGVSLALDDFGTGYSSLSHVHRLPVDKLKIDQSFTREMTTNASARNIVASIIGLARNLKLESVVEGVETASQAIQLEAFGCHLLQGYLFSKPLPESEVVQYLLQERSDTLSAATNAARMQSTLIAV